MDIELKSKFKIKNLLPCNNCPLKLDNNENNVKFGKGNLYANTVIILPFYNRDKHDTYNLLDLIDKIYNKETNKNLLDYYYVTNLPKCFSNITYTYEIRNQSIVCCKDILIAEIKYYCKNFNKIIICDKEHENVISKYINNNIFDCEIKFINNPIVYLNLKDNQKPEILNEIN